MKFLNKKVLTSVLLTLMFSVAVSGGCGGGSSGHYSGNFGDSSQEITTEFVSQDVIEPEPEEPVLSDQFGSENGDDEYGAGKINAFTLFTMTTWSIDQIAVYNSNGASLNVSRDYSKNYKITLITTNNSMTYALDEKQRKNLPFGDVNVQFKAPKAKAWQVAPVLRSSNKFVELIPNAYYQASITDKRSLGNGTVESIQVLGYVNNNNLFANKINVENQFTAADKEKYMSRLLLSRVNDFPMLDQSNWQIKSRTVIGPSGETRDYRVTGTEPEKIKKITLLTSVDNNVRVLNFMIDNKAASEPIKLTFIDTTRENPGAKIYLAPILRPSSNFQSKGRQKDYEIFEATFQDEAIPEPYRSQDKYFDRQVMYISDYGPYGTITIHNSFFLKNDSGTFDHYWATLVLEPYGTKN